MRDISQITDDELSALVSRDISLEAVKNILSDTSIYENGRIKEQDFSYLYAEALRDQIEYESDSDAWQDQHFNNLIQGELTARDINFWIDGPSLIFVTTLSTKIDKTIEKFTHWINDNKQKIIMVEKFISGEAIIKTDHPLSLDVNLYSSSGINISDLSYEFNSKLYGIFDTQWISDVLSAEQKNIIASGFSSGANEYMEENGWHIDHVDLWFYGPIEVTETKEYIYV